MALRNDSSISVVQSVEPLRGQVGEVTATWDQQMGNKADGSPYYIKNSYTAFFFQTGTVTTTLYPGLSKAKALELEASFTKQDLIGIANGSHGTAMPYVRKSQRASARQVNGRMYEVVVVLEERTVEEYNSSKVVAEW